MQFSTPVTHSLDGLTYDLAKQKQGPRGDKWHPHLEMQLSNISKGFFIIVKTTHWKGKVKIKTKTKCDSLFFSYNIFLLLWKQHI